MDLAPSICGRLILPVFDFLNYSSSILKVEIVTAVQNYNAAIRISYDILMDIIPSRYQIAVILGAELEDRYGFRKLLVRAVFGVFSQSSHLTELSRSKLICAVYGLNYRTFFL